MTQTAKKKAYDRIYRKDNIKRVPLDMQNKDYDALKAAADSAGVGVNAYIKAAIREKMSRDAAADEGGGGDSNG